MTVLFLNPPSIFGRYDSAGARFAAVRKTNSLWYPAWLGYGAALVPDSKLLDCPASNVSLKQLLQLVKNYQLIVIYTSTQSFANDVAVAEKIKMVNLKSTIVFTGPPVSVQPEKALKASRAIDAVARREFDFTIYDITQGKPWTKIKGLSFRQGRKIIHNPDRPILIDLDKLPFVAPIYKRDLDITKYHLPFCLYPYISIYAGRGCPNQCTFCLWPQTFTGHLYRKRSVENVIEEVKWIKNNLTEVKEIFFDDDTFIIDFNWVNKFCRQIKSLNITWSVNTRANVPLSVLKNMKSSGCRYIMVGYESGNDRILQNIHKGIAVAPAKAFMKNAKKAGLMIHGGFILGLPGETKQTIEETFRFACELDCDTIQVTIATAFPGTEFYDYLVANRYLKNEAEVDALGYQAPTVSYPKLTATEIQQAVEQFTLRYYLRPAYIVKTFKKAISSWEEAKRIAISIYEFGRYLIKNISPLF